jgi:hypothetical protein
LAQAQELRETLMVEVSSVIDCQFNKFPVFLVCQQPPSLLGRTYTTSYETARPKSSFTVNSGNIFPYAKLQQTKVGTAPIKKRKQPDTVSNGVGNKKQLVSE